MRQAIKITAIIAAMIFVISWFTHGIMINTYVNYPRQPQPEQGDIVPYYVKGIVVYIEASDDLFLHYLKLSELISGAAASIFVILHSVGHLRSRK